MHKNVLVDADVTATVNEGRDYPPDDTYNFDSQSPTEKLHILYAFSAGDETVSKVSLLRCFFAPIL